MTRTDSDKIAAAIAQRGVKDVFHFTTNKGLLGILATRALKARYGVTSEEYLENIATPNASYRRDPRWAGHVSLSISRVNTAYFAWSIGQHSHEDLWWCVISLQPAVLCHEGVVFVTVNNIWPSALRSEGAAGFDALFAPAVSGRYSSIERRTASTPTAWTTCVQAEALYPGQIASDYFQRIYVLDDRHAAVVEGQLAAVDHPAVEVVVDDSVFSLGHPRS